MKTLLTAMGVVAFSASLASANDFVRDDLVAMKAALQSPKAIITPVEYPQSIWEEREALFGNRDN